MGEKVYKKSFTKISHGDIIKVTWTNNNLAKSQKLLRQDYERERERERVKNAHSALIYQISKHYFNGAFCILNKY